jgi:nicotinate phosphoribosyltransferase
MAIVSELYFSWINPKWTLENYENQTVNKALTLSSCNYSEFGTRRRRSYETQNSVIQTLKNKNGFQGTSNVHFAHMYDLRPIGTMAHEWIMGISALEGLQHANRHALRAWSKVFKGNLGIALTDTFGSDAFFEDFDGYTARLFDGVRHDSGDPHTFAEKTIKAYNKLHIDPLTKAIIFSDGLTPIDAIAIKNQWDKFIKVRFGIGTNFTNDFGSNSPALNMVIKLTECAGVPVVKLSDTPSKAIGDPDALRVAKWTFFKIPLDNANGN